MPFPSRERLLKNSFPLESETLLWRNPCPYFTIITFSFLLPESFKGSFSELYQENLVSFSVVEPMKMFPPNPKTTVFKNFSFFS